MHSEEESQDLPHVPVGSHAAHRAGGGDGDCHCCQGIRCVEAGGGHELAS